MDALAGLVLKYGIGWAVSALNLTAEAVLDLLIWIGGPFEIDDGLAGASGFSDEDLCNPNIMGPFLASSMGVSYSAFSRVGFVLCGTLYKHDCPEDCPFNGFFPGTNTPICQCPKDREIGLRAASVVGISEEDKKKCRKPNSILHVSANGTITCGKTEGTLKPVVPYDPGPPIDRSGYCHYPSVQVGTDGRGKPICAECPPPSKAAGVIDGKLRCRWPDGKGFWFPVEQGLQPCQNPAECPAGMVETGRSPSGCTVYCQPENNPYWPPSVSIPFGFVDGEWVPPKCDPPNTFPVSSPEGWSCQKKRKRIIIKQPRNRKQTAPPRDPVPPPKDPIPPPPISLKDFLGVLGVPTDPVPPPPPPPPPKDPRPKKESLEVRFNSCVSQLMGQGMSLSDAVEVCRDLLMPDSSYNRDPSLDYWKEIARSLISKKRISTNSHNRLY
jgi:hypothetical protein